MKGYISGKRERNGDVTIRVDGRRLDPASQPGAAQPQPHRL